MVVARRRCLSARRRTALCSPREFARRARPAGAEARTDRFASAAPGGVPAAWFEARLEIQALAANAPERDWCRPDRRIRPALLASDGRGVAEATAVDAPYAKLEQLEPGIARVLAHNPSAFTYYGTQTYLIGDGRGRGDRSRARPARACRGAGGAIGGRKVTAIMCTHTHRDHSPAARPLAERDRRADHRLRAAGAGDGRPARRCVVRRRLCAGPGARPTATRSRLTARR